jgi:hypothetical protein
MDPEIQAQIDQAVAAIKAKAQADLEAQKAQIKKEAQAEVLAAIKSQFGV